MKLINNRPIIILIYLSYLKDEVNKNRHITILIYLSYLKDEVNKQQTYYNINISVLFKG